MPNLRPLTSKTGSGPRRRRPSGGWPGGSCGRRRPRRPLGRPRPSSRGGPWGQPGKADDGGHPVPGEGLQDALQLSPLDIDGQLTRLRREVRQPPEDRLRTAEDLHAHPLALGDALPDQGQGLHRSRGQKGGLPGGDLHPAGPTQGVVDAELDGALGVGLDLVTGIGRPGEGDHRVDEVVGPQAPLHQQGQGFRADPGEGPSGWGRGSLLARLETTRMRLRCHSPARFRLCSPW